MQYSSRTGSFFRDVPLQSPFRLVPSHPSCREVVEMKRILHAEEEKETEQGFSGIGKVHLRKSAEKVAAGQHAETENAKAHLWKSSSSQSSPEFIFQPTIR
ncbi:hypothetical protein ACLOJK_002855 [Asimina triloba]